MKMIIFDYRDSEKSYFENNELTDFEIKFRKEPLNELTVLSEEELYDTDIISVFISSNVTENIIKKFKNLRIITTRSTSVDHIDINYCFQNNIAVFNVANYGEVSAAQYTFMLIIALTRQLIPAYIDVQRSFVKHENYEGHNLSNLTLGLIGCGAIGRAVAKIANFFGMKVYICDFEKDNELSPFAEYTTKDELLKNSDIVSIHLSHSKECRHIINEETLSKMKDGSFLINIADGNFVDTVALYNALIGEKLKGAALDITECNKFSVTENIDFSSENSNCVSAAFAVQKLLGMNNVIITPRIAYNTRESVNTTLETTFNNIRDFFKGMHTNQLR